MSLEGKLRWAAGGIICNGICLTSTITIQTHQSNCLHSMSMQVGVDISLVPRLKGNSFVSTCHKTKVALGDGYHKFCTLTLVKQPD